MQEKIRTLIMAVVFCCLPRPDHDRTEKYRRAGTDYGTGRTGRLADTLVYLQQ